MDSAGSKKHFKSFVFPVHNKGRGWHATVVRCSRDCATVSFTYARDRHGKAYANALLSVNVLQPF